MAQFPIIPDTHWYYRKDADPLYTSKSISVILVPALQNWLEAHGIKYDLVFGGIADIMPTDIIIENAGHAMLFKLTWL